MNYNQFCNHQEEWKKAGDKPSDDDMENLISSVQGRESKASPGAKARQKRKDNPGDLTKKFGMGRTERENVLGRTMAHKMRADFMDAKKRGVSMEDFERLNFTKFLEATEDIEPIYQIEGEFPKCPRGYQWDRKSKRCIPKTEQDDVGNAKEKKDNSPDNGPGYNVIGHTGIDGDGYAYAERVGWGGDNMSIGSDNP